MSKICGGCAATIAEDGSCRCDARPAKPGDIPTISVHVHCTACGGSGLLGGLTCHCMDRMELAARVLHSSGHAALASEVRELSQIMRNGLSDSEGWSAKDEARARELVLP